jgi:hypothetical protein
MTRLGSAKSRLFSQRSAVDFAKEWIIEKSSGDS